MNRDSVIHILKKVDVTNLAGEKVLVDFMKKKYFIIQGPGNDIWNMLADGIHVQDIISNLLKEYDVTEDCCEQEVYGFLEKLEKFGFIEVK